MGMLDFAKEIEMKGFQHYSELAKTADTKEISSIFGYLAKEEKRHYKIFDSWQRNVNIPPLGKSNILRNSKLAFRKLAKHFNTLGVSAVNRDDAYGKALSFENKSIDLYTNALNKITDNVEFEEQGNMLKVIIDQEKKHARLITALMEFQRHPGEWLENAEWNHLDEY